tara:strand:+ start:10398 stop:13952 length:3555 start_codon:yes stop_codon:yes gene_type:complete
MSSTDRQNRLLVAEDWKRVYQSYKNADFQSYDFDNLRRTMINYLRENYPEDFNDYIESSEYLALIDLIAYLGQNLAFRMDLNARENYLELAERRESVLRLARLLSYNPKRNQCANGLLKIASVSTTEEVKDSNNINLKDQTILWNDSSNTNWYEQFIKVLNRALPVNGTYGRPVKKETVAGVPTEQYRFNSTNADVPAFSFNKTIDGNTTRFEIVSSDINNGAINEEAPFPGNNFAFLYRDDGQGASSSNSGFFCHFRQGTLDQGTFAITNPSTNQTVSIDATNINNSDLWLYKLDSFGNEDELWTRVDSVEGNNVVYNSLSKNIRNVYSVLTRINDRISVIFSDGVFGNLPQGTFRAYYRTSRNAKIVIKPRDLRGVSIDIPYLSRTGKIEQISLIFELQYTVDNASVSETNANIRSRAPATYYTQNRLITGEDYQIGPLSSSQEIIKVKSVNRTSSGLSRYFDLTDATGKYSKTNLFGTDGVLYKEVYNKKTKFNFSTSIDVQGTILNIIEPILGSKEVYNFYSSQFPKIDTTDLNITWTQNTKDTNVSTGYFKNVNDIRQFLGQFTTSVLKLIKPGASIKLQAPAGKHFMPDGTLMNGAADHLNSRTYKWVKVVSVNGNGTLDNTDGTGPVTFNDVIPTSAQLVEIKPTVSKKLEDDVKTQLIDQTVAYLTYGLRFDRDLGQWRIITANNLNATGDFSIGKTGDITGQQLDASWLLKFTTDGNTYTIDYKGSRYVFESDKEIRFYYDSSDKIYNNLTGKIVKDKITVLNNNNKPDSVEKFTVDFDWEITKEFRDKEGYVNSKKIEVTFFDQDDDGVVDDPQIFEEIVQETNNPTTKYIFNKRYTTSDGVEDFNYISKDELKPIVLQNKGFLGALSQYDNGQVFYFIDEDIFEVYNGTTVTTSLTTEYKAYIGREGLRFQYVHAADDSSRIDPSASNIIDCYMLTRSYDTQFRQYLDGTLATKPLQPSSDALYTAFGQQLNNIKSLSDEIIYSPVKYRVLFGDKAELDLQAKFKIVKNPDLVLNDNDIKSRVISSINKFFALENWDFGDKFYFSELSTYVMNDLAPDIVTFIIVPEQVTQVFGSLYEIKSEVDEIFISGATVDDLEIIDAITATRLQAQGNVTTAGNTINVGIQSSPNTTSSPAITTSGTVSSSSSSSSSGSGGSGGSGSGGSGSGGGGYGY